MKPNGGDGQAEFRSLYERSHLQVLSYCLRRTPERETALDAAAETYVVAWRRFDDLPTAEGDQIVWLFGVARRVLANQRRSEERRVRALDRHGQLAEVQDDSPETHAMGLEERQQVLRALSRLSDDDQELLRLHAWEGLSGRELAQHFECTENALHVRLHRARQRLARSFDREARADRPWRRSAKGGDAS